MGTQQIIKLLDKNGKICDRKEDIMKIIQDYYTELYRSSTTRQVINIHDSRANLSRHFTEDFPPISIWEIQLALKMTKNNVMCTLSSSR